MPLTQEKIKEILAKISEFKAEPATEEITQKIAKIKNICDTHYWDKRFSGNAALNRKILLDSEIADLLTPDVIRFLFTNKPTENEELKRSLLSKENVSIKDAVSYGLDQELFVLEHHPNNDMITNLLDYKQKPAEKRAKKQKEDFNNKTLRIVKNIQIASLYADRSSLRKKSFRAIL